MTEGPKTIGEIPLEERKPLVFLCTFSPNNFGKGPDEFDRDVDAEYPASIIGRAEKMDKEGMVAEHRKLFEGVLMHCQRSFNQP